MITARRAARVRYEFRLGSRELLVLGVASALVAGGVFAAGLLVGRAVGGGARPSALAEGPRGPARVDPGAPPAGAPVKPGAGAEEKFTFYRTLTAPTTSDLPAVAQPRVEERMVPGGESGPAAGREGAREAAQAAPAPAARPVPGRPGLPIARAPARSAKAPATPAPPRSAPTVAAGGPVPAAADGAWTVQVSAFRSRVLADELRTRLAARGFDAYVLASASDDGRARYRVRVGAYATRGEAERVAAELRAERGLNPIVTSRVR
jgi:cell division septation protein DedD